MATITGSTRTTTRTDTTAYALAFAFVGVALVALAFLSIGERFLPAAHLNTEIAAKLADAKTLATDQRFRALSALTKVQEDALARKPAEPFAWMRLAYLRLATQGANAEAFAALKMSDVISPEEPRQLPERALMWHRLSAYEATEEQTREAVLWQKAFRLERDETYVVAQHNGLTDVVGQALKQGDPDLFGEWQARVSAPP